MKSKSTPITLKSIAQLINEKFDAVYKRFDGVDKKISGVETKIVGVYGELDGIKQQISGLDNKITNLEVKMDKGFSDVYGVIGNLADAIDHDLEPRLKRLEDKKSFSPAN